ncbi:DUF6705 family protein [Chitinophaga niabensis]|uniref:DUF6705 domain-containing protein n=1 Tax=Chitinophaga niabensis TaxID=536979 RepID=A0A1N6E3M2_9BACT|nr:DUF6705 family protein [Chitinophaga niabensis]SIN77616.1 hypothetical protein SAMN04488055_1278 [Chitinophaga niabensis]
MQTRLTIILLALLFSVRLFGQTKGNSNKERYTRDPELAKYTGTWQWKSDSTIFTIVLRQVKLHFSGTGKSKDVIIGWHSYYENGVLLESSQDRIASAPLKEMEDTLLAKVATITATTPTKPSTLSIYIHDLTRKREFSGHLELIPGKPDAAIWETEYRSKMEFYFKDKPPAYMSGRTVPTGIVMRKIR